MKQDNAETAIVQQYEQQRADRKLKLMDRKWDEIPTTCEGCGLCCMHMAVPPYLATEPETLRNRDPAAYADFLDVKDSRSLQWIHVGEDFIPCGFFDMVTRQCRHHDSKPSVCTEFEIGGDACMEFRRSVADAAETQER